VTTYDPKLKSSILARLLPPNSESVPQLAKSTGIPSNTLHGWLHAHRKKNGLKTKANENSEPSTQEKFAVVLKCATMTEIELSSYCREQGLYPDQVEQWRLQCELANATTASGPEKQKAQKKWQALKKAHQQLTSELQRKEKALAEMAALLVLQKKFQALWEAEAQ
jgi:transposase-like protein